MFGFSDKKLDWTVPASIEELTSMMEDTSQPLLIFKHSERCPISRMALSQFEKEYDLENIRLVFIEVRENRPMSNFVEEEWGVIHQSPQAIIQSNDGRKTSYSHNSISVEKIKTFLAG